MSKAFECHPDTMARLETYGRTRPCYRYLTKEVMGAFRKVGDQSEVGHLKDVILVAKYFTPDANWTWYAAEFDEENGIFWGFVDGFEEEWGTFSLDEMEGIRGALGLPIERHLHWDPTPFGQLVKR